METLQATVRTIVGKATRRLRRDGFLPAVLYGQGLPTRSIAVPMTAFQALWRRSGENTLLALKVTGEDATARRYDKSVEDLSGKPRLEGAGEQATEEGGADDEKKPETVIIHDVARDPLRGAPMHADFYRVNMAEPLRMFVPLEFVGESPAVTEQEGVLFKQVHELEIEALPENLPKSIVVDISPLRTFDDLITLDHIALPEHVKAFGEADMVIAAVQAPRSAEELAGLETQAVPSVADIELSEKRGKEEDVEVENKAADDEGGEQSAASKE